MPNVIVRQAQQMGMSIYHLTSRSESSTTVLSSGALASIAVAGSVIFFLIIVGPVLIKLAKRRRRRRETEGSVTSLSSAEHGQLSQDEHFIGPKRLRKRSVVSDGVMYFGMKDIGSEEGSRSGDGRAARHLSLPILPPVSSYSGSFGTGVHFSGGGSGDVGGNRNGDDGNKARPGSDACADEKQMYRSPERHRGRAIYQNRRKTSWIDEDALHGPRVSSKKDKKRKPSWLSGRGLTRTLSRHLSIRRFYAPELDRSPTLPFIEPGQGREIADGTSGKSPESRKSIYTESPHRSHELKTETEIKPRFPTQQPPQQGRSPNNSRVSRVQLGSSGQQQRASVPGAVPPIPRYYNNTAINAAQQLAGRARVPSFDLGVNGQRHSRLQQSNTDTELQAILRRTAERLQDGNRSARRQTLMLPTSSSPARVLDQTRRGPDQDYGNDKAHTRPGSTVSSPAKSQKSAPAAMMYAELEDRSPKNQHGPSQNNAPWQTHRRTHRREISHISQISMLSEPESMVATPSKRISQADMLHTALSSPSRTNQTPPSHPQQVLIPRSYSPASEQSSALSTVYSEEEENPPMSVLKPDNAPGGGSEMERRAMAEALRASDAFYNKQTPRDDNAGNGEGRREERADIKTSPHRRTGTLERVIPSSTQTAASSPSERQDRIKQPTARFSPQAISTAQNLQTETEDPFTAHTTPKRHTPQRLSHVFSPIPTKQPGDTMSASADTTEPHSGTPTPSPSRRRVIPPPHRLRPGANSPTLGHYHDPQFQIQPPSREPSPVESESGLSSVYDSYRYSRYSDSVEAGSQMLARLSAATTTTMLTVPPAEESPPTKNRWDQQTPLPAAVAVSAESQTSDGAIENGGAAAFRSAHARLNNALSYTHFAAPLRPSATENGSTEIRYTAAKDALPRSQPHRDITSSTVSYLSAESAYSQDEDGGDKLAPLMPIYPATAAPGKHTSRVMNAVAELRRMNSQVSNVSAYSTATTNITSPTLPALRGGGCSPGKKGAVGSSKNYFSLGSSPSSRDSESEYGHEESRRYDVGNLKVDEVQNDKMVVPVEISKEIRNEYSLRKGGSRRSRRNTVVGSYERDLDRARQTFRESRGYNLQAIREVSNNVGPGRLMAQVAE
ncbi:hypothetical protein F4859DRAFT_12107 [Xylaria cf. heliscus]|nr:hypothetical protein F4859DRAFT_12107 [Xylaria cf. heliscus]